MRPALFLSTALAVAGVSGLAGAQNPPPSGTAPPAPPGAVALTLDYRLGPGAASCPAESELRAWIKGRTEYDPFAPPAPGKKERRLIVSVTGHPEGFVSTATYEDAAGAKVWDKPRTYFRSGREAWVCRNLIELVAAYFAWELILLPPEPDPEPAPAPVPAARSAKSPPPATPAPEAATVPAVAVQAAAPAMPPEAVRPRIAPFIGVGGRADFGIAGGILLGLTVEGGVRREEWRWGGWSLKGELGWAPQQVESGSAVAGTINLQTWLVAGRLAGCIHRAWPVRLAGCVLGELGTIHQSAGTLLYRSAYQTAVFAGGGVRARIEVPLPARLHVQVEMDVLGVGKAAGGTSASVKLPTRSLGGAAGGLGAGLAIWF